MSPKAEVAIVLKDYFSDTLKEMQERQRTFTKDLEGMQKRLAAINQAKAKVQIETSAAQKALKDAEKAYAALNSEANKENLENARANINNLGDSMQSLKRETKEVTRAMEDLYGTNSKLDNMGGGAAGGSEGGAGGAWPTAGAILSSQLATQLTSSVSSYLNSSIASAYGSGVGASAANIGGGLFSGAAAGATMGMAGGPIGALIGGAIGAGVGLLSGVIKDSADKLSEKDDLFRGIVTNIYDEVLTMREEMVTIGSAVAAQRETNLTAFATMLRSEVALPEDAYGPAVDPKWYADKFMSEVVDYARTTPFGYEELVNISKTLLTYGYASERIIPMLTQIGDAGAALGWDAQAKVSAATYIGRMQMSDKVTMQYLNPLIAQGLDAIGYIRQSLEQDNAGITNSDVMEMVSKGELSGKAVSEVLLQFMGYDFGGAMEELQNSYDGLTSTLEDWEEEMQAALGEGYNERRKEQMKTQIDWYEKHADELSEMYRVVGEYEADLLGAKEETMRTSFEDLLERAKDISDPSEMSQELYNAIVDAKVAYYDTEAYDSLYTSQQELVNRVQQDLKQVNWDCGYALGQELTKGYNAALSDNPLAPVLNSEIYSIASSIAEGFFPAMTSQRAILGSPEKQAASGSGPIYNIASSIAEGFFPAMTSQRAILGSLEKQASGAGGKYAYGLDRVPYDNYPALLHQGERVLTASQAREADSGGGARTMTINIYNPTVRDDSDIDAIANAIYERLLAADAVYAG